MENPDLKNTSDEDLLKIIALYLNSGIYRISNNRENVLEVLEKFRSALCEYMERDREKNSFDFSQPTPKVTPEDLGKAAARWIGGVKTTYENGRAIDRIDISVERLGYAILHVANEYFLKNKNNS
jgi:hypothetical protein